MGLRLGVELTAWHKHYGKLNIIAVEKKLMRLCPNCGYIPFPIRTTQLLGYTECFPTYFILLALAMKKMVEGHIIILLGWASQEISFMVVLMAPIFRWSTTLGRTSIYVKIMVH